MSTFTKVLIAMLLTQVAVTQAQAAGPAAATVKGGKPAQAAPALQKGAAAQQDRLSETQAQIPQGQPFTLTQALGQFDTSPKVERAESMKEEASWKSVEAASGFIPRISASATRVLDQKFMLVDVAGFPQSIPQIMPTTIYTLGGDWTLFDGLSSIERFQGAKAFQRAAENDADWTKFQGARDTILLYYRALAAQTLKEVAEANLKTLADHLNDVRLFKQAGAGTKFDVLRVEVQESEAKSEVLNQTDNVTISMLRLGEQLGQDLKGRYLDSTLPVLGPELVANVQYDERKRGDLEAMKARVEGAERSAQAANKFWVPSVALSGAVQQYNNLTNDLTGTGFRTAYSAAVNLRWNLYDGGISIARDRQTVEQKVQAEKTLAIQRQRSGDDFEYWRRRYLYNASIYQARVNDIEKSTESVRLAREGRRVGARTNTDLLDAEAELFRARAGLVNAQIGAVEALINLEVATGQQLYSFK